MTRNIVEKSTCGFSFVYLFNGNILDLFCMIMLLKLLILHGSTELRIMDERSYLRKTRTLENQYLSLYFLVASCEKFHKFDVIFILLGFLKIFIYLFSCKNCFPLIAYPWLFPSVAQDFLTHRMKASVQKHNKIPTHPPFM